MLHLLRDRDLESLTCCALQCGRSALWLSIDEVNTEVVKLLIDEGANIDPLDSHVSKTSQNTTDTCVSHYAIPL